MKQLQFIKCGFERSSKIGALALLVFNVGSTGVHAELPVRHATIPWSNNVQILSQSANALHIGQVGNQSGNWLLNWQSFNVSEGSSVQFHQPSTSHIALNRIFSDDASRIMGSIDANGRVYLINSNGFLFGSNSKINVNSLVASTLALNMSDDEFINGDKNIANIINENEAAFIGAGSLDEIKVEKGAEINAADGGSILMFASTIFNEGDINTSSGQVILAAAKDKVYLTPSTDPALRGFLVEVETGGDVTNLGKILAEKGNVTLAGLAINQNNIVRATSSVNENGSIRLLARDGATVINDIDDSRDELILGIDINKAKDAQGNFLVRDSYVVATHTGTVILGENSKTIIDIDTSSRDIVDDSRTDNALVTDSQNIEKSRIEITGQEIRLKKAAEIIAPGAKVTLHATSNPQQGAINKEGKLNSKDSVSKIILETGSVINVAGTTDTQVDMSRNQLDVTLTANFLRDSPLQREGPLRDGEIKTVTLDIRDGTPLGDISNLLDTSVKRGISERLSAGGDINILSQGAVLLDTGSEINISAGSIQYNEGFVTSSQLVTFNGQLVDIADADPNVIYTDTFGEAVVKSARWGGDATQTWRLFSGENGGVTRFHEAYTEGSDAGSLTVQTHAAILDQNLLAGSINGTLQREVSDRSSAGTYNILLPTFAPIASTTSQSVSLVDQRLLSDDELNSGKETVINNFLSSNQANPNWVLQIQDDIINNSGLQSLNINTNGNISFQEKSDLQLASGGSLNLQAKAIQLDSDIHIASGDVSLNSYADLLIDKIIDVSGNWINDSEFVADRDLSRNVNLNGGSISLQTDNGNLLLSDSNLLVNGGAWLTADDKLKLGNAGSIKLAVDDINNLPANLELGNMQAFAAGRGGSLQITANNIDISNELTGQSTTGSLQITPDFFEENGFSDYTLISNTDNLILHNGSHITPTTQSLLLNSDFKSISSVNKLTDISHIITLPDYLKPSTNLTLGTSRDGPGSLFGEGLRISENSSITAVAGADISLFAIRNIFINGAVNTQGGDVSVVIDDNGDSSTPYIENSAIWLGEQGSINTQGVVVADAINDIGRRTGRILNSGNVTLQADRGYIVLEEGSRIDTSGTQNELDITSKVLGNSVIAYEKASVYSDAGDISFTAAEGMLIKGQLNAASANSQAGGLLSVVLDTSNRVNDITRNTTTDTREIHLLQNTSGLPENFLLGQQGSDINSDFIGKAYIGVDTIHNGGFDSLLLKSNNVTDVSAASGTGVVVFEDNINLQLGQSLQILAPVIRAQGNASDQVNISAPYVLLGSLKGEKGSSDVTASNGNSQFNVQAGLNGNTGLLEIVGDLRLQGIIETNLSSEGDIRLRGVQNSTSSTRLTGQLETQGNLNLQANQIYATTLSQYELNVSNASNGVLSIRGGDAPSAVLSAGSQLSLNAPIIQQSGVIKAPLGQINFNASQQLIIADDSLTSVSGEGLLVPFGSTLGEERWIYPFDTNSQFFADIISPPAKEINIQSPDIQVSDNAVLDVSGGGDLLSWEFVPGIGGSVDTLLPENANGAFAVIPGTSAFAPYDYQYWLGENGREVGEQIYLTGNADLAAGVYTVLPARYALLPGAYLISPTGKNILPSQRFNRLDGAPVVAGQERFAGTDYKDSLWSGYVIENGEDVRLRSQYIESTAGQFFRDEAINNDKFLTSMPADAGTLNIMAGLNLDLSGILQGDAAAYTYSRDGQVLTGFGRGSQVNISADNLRVVNALDNNGGNQLLAQNLNNLNANSLMLGGVRQRNDNGILVNVLSDKLEIESGVNLDINELFIVATDTVDIRSGVTITTKGAQKNTDTQINIQGDGALFYASANNQIRVNRSGESLSPIKGIVNIESGSIIDSSRAVAIDSSANTIIDGQLKLNGGSLNLGAAKISIGNSNGQATGLAFSIDDLTNMNAGELFLTSRSSVNLYGELDLQLDNLSIEAASLNGYQLNGQQASIGANSIRLGNPSNSVSNEVASGVGHITLNANNIELSAGDFNINGFNNVTFNSENIINLSADGSLTTNINGDFLLDASALTASSGVKYSVFAGNSDLTLLNSSIEKYTRGDLGLGAQVELQAKNINQQGVIDMASGYLTLNATDELLLETSSIINLSGIERDFSGESIYTNGGVLTLGSFTKNVTMQNNALINVSAGAGQGKAGAINIHAINGHVDIKGQLLASHGVDDKAASAYIDAQSIYNFSQLNTQLNINGFNQDRVLRIRQNNIEIGVNDSIVANNVWLQSDMGDVIIQGVIDAKNKDSASVYLAAGNDVRIGSAASIDASVTHNDGGKIIFESRDGRIDLAVGSSLNVSGSSANENGSLSFRASRDVNGDAQITSLASNLQGVSRIDIESYKSYDISQLNIAVSESVNFFSELALNTLGLFTTSNVHQHKGIELISQSDINFNTNLNLFNNRDGDDAGVLTLRSAGNVNVNRSIVDGFSGGRLQQGESWSYNIIAGADFSAASLRSVNQGVGDFTLSENKSISTGKGDIFITAGNNITLARNASIYTAGESTGRGSYVNVAGFGNALDGFLLPNVEFPDQGGDVTLQAGGDIKSNPSSVLVSDWLYRLGDKYNLGNGYDDIGTSWGIDFTKFKHGVGALGGGDVNINAIGNISGLSAFTPTTGKQLAELAIDPNTFVLTINGNIVEQHGKGDINVSAGGDVSQMLLFAANGRIDVNVVGDIGNNVASNGLAIIYANTQTNINAGGNINFLGANNFSLLPLSKNQQAANNGAAPIENYESFFTTYSETAQIDLSSLNGDIEIISPDIGQLSSIYKNSAANDLNNRNAAARLFSNYPGSFHALAINGDINIQDSIVLLPSNQGDLSLLAQNNITGFNGSGALSVSMLDINQDDLPSIQNTSNIYSTDIFPTRVVSHAGSSANINSPNPVRIVANTGDIQSIDVLIPFIFETNKQTEIIAGNDIINVSLNIQNNSLNDISLIQAGRDIRYINSAEFGNPIIRHGIEISGPGELQVLAGRNIDLGDQRGIVSTGNNINPSLIDKSASLLIMAGLGEQGADYSGFIDAYFTADSEYSVDLIEFMNSRGEIGLSFNEALNRFKNLDEKDQRKIVASAFSNETSESGIRAANEQNGSTADNEILGYTRGLDAIDTLFPGTIQNKRFALEGELTQGNTIVTGGFAYTISDVNPQYSGNLSMVSSAIQVQDNGADIFVYTPGGFVNVGLSVSSGKDLIEKGIITKGNGSINVFSQGDVAVNQSRIQALNGGDISIWSTKGDVDAGKGAKDAINIPPPRIIVDPESGAVIQVFDAVVQGSGIQSACFDSSCIDGNVVLTAPAGVIDAGDAGIRSGGNISVAGTDVINANQIEAGGDVSGNVGGATALGSDLGGLDVNSSSDSAASELIAEDASAQYGAGSVAILQVEVMGLSGEPDVIGNPAENNSNQDDKNDAELDFQQLKKQVKNKPIFKEDLSQL